MLDLLDYRRRVSELYAHVRHAEDIVSAWRQFREARDALFRSHPESPLDSETKSCFDHLDYYDYDPSYRVTAPVNRDVEPLDIAYDLGSDGRFHCTRFGQVSFTLPSGDAVLNLYWINGYGGSLFLPFGDATNRQTTYGGGRYLYDTIKGADLGVQNGELVLDFNFAYNPSCAYSPRWVCPLAPLDNRLTIVVSAGEKHPIL
jgi:hypothetical protein